MKIQSINNFKINSANAVKPAFKGLALRNPDEVVFPERWEQCPYSTVRYTQREYYPFADEIPEEVSKKQYEYSFHSKGYGYAEWNDVSMKVMATLPFTKEEFLSNEKTIREQWKKEGSRLAESSIL